MEFTTEEFDAAVKAAVKVEVTAQMKKVKPPKPLKAKQVEKLNGCFSPRKKVECLIEMLSPKVKNDAETSA